MLDDFGLAPLADDTVRDLLEILDDRYDRRSTLITSQLPIDQWQAYLGDRTVADAILDRLVLKGESMRRHRTVASKPLTKSSTTNTVQSPLHHRPGFAGIRM